MSETAAWHDAASDIDEPATSPAVAPPAAAAANDAEQPAAAAAAASLDGDPGLEAVLPDGDPGGEVEPGHDELEHGIASVIASLYADSRDTGAAAVDAPGSTTAEPEGPAADDDVHEAIAADAEDDALDGSEPVPDDDFDEAITYRLLGELDRLWHHRAA